ncbi:MAG: NAD-dependent epimerase/dehydratase family protein [Spirochaetales bacterium]|nr:NAD-dependent epimerase/dehydratase family protein [Leptospiraceae bacterium]MCP5480280.1 NAD-dependent epimerase/dehydratase family protein [Spirochaetales bacterium]MCP5486821.1 NAD-dependent epimerase/dehydratase family protein [Spirochaetales bacterium]
MAKYFITGGAGFLGINLVRYLLDKRHTCVSYDFADFDYPEKDDRRVKIVKGDIRDFESLKKAMKGCEVVIHCAAALPLYTEEDIMTTDVDGTKNVLEAAKQLKIKRVVHVSSTAVYGIPDHHPLYEDDKKHGVGPYGEAKILAEKACEEYRQKKMIVPVIRPKSFIGPERLGVFAMFFDWARDGHGFPMLGNGRNRYQLLDVEDLCDAIYLCAKGPATKVNDTFNIGAKEFTTMKEDFQAVLDAAGYGKKIRTFPAGPLIFVLRILEKLGWSPLYKWVYETASTDSFVSIEKAEKILRYKPKYSNKDALVRNYQWYLENEHNFREASGISHRVPWKQGILRLAKVFF